MCAMCSVAETRNAWGASIMIRIVEFYSEAGLLYLVKQFESKQSKIGNFRFLKPILNAKI